MAFDANALTWTSTQVLSDVRRKASLPTTATDFSDAVILREATDVLWSFAGWAIAQGGDGRMIATLDRPVTGALPGAYRAGSEFDLPALAVADTIENLTWFDASGNHQSRLTRIDPSQESDYDTVDSEGSPSTYTLGAGRVRVYPRPTTGGSFRITYQRRHPELVVDVEGTSYARVTAAGVDPLAPTDATRMQFTIPVSAPPFTLAVGDEVDLVSSQQPYRVLATGMSVTATSGTSVSVVYPLARLAGSNVVGARLVRAGQSTYVHYPLELRACISEKVAANLLRIVGDGQGMQACETAALLELARVMQMLSPRSKRDKPRAINPYSHLRSRLSRGGRW